MKKEEMKQKLKDIETTFNNFDKNITFHELLENGKMQSFILWKDYLFLRSEIVAIIKGETINGGKD